MLPAQTAPVRSSASVAMDRSGTPVSVKLRDPADAAQRSNPLSDVPIQMLPSCARMKHCTCNPDNSDVRSACSLVQLPIPLSKPINKPTPGLDNRVNGVLPGGRDRGQV